MMRTSLAALGAAALLFAPVSCARRAADPALVRDIDAIKAIDNHAHVVRPVNGDRDYDALPLDGIEPSDSPVFLRPENPAFARAWKAFFKYPYEDASAAHQKEALALKTQAMRQQGAGYPAWVLDQMGTDVILANRIAMGPELQGRRFKWVPYADALIFPLENTVQKGVNHDYASLYPLEEKLLRRYLDELGVAALPATLAEYCSRVITPLLERQKAGGAVAEKFEIAYLRSLDFGPASEEDASRVYANNVKAGIPSAADYKTLQDYLFAYTAREAGRLGLAVHIHVANGGGSNYDQRGSDPVLLTWLFNEPSLRKTNFVIVHGGYPYIAETSGLMGKPNVYADNSMWWCFSGVPAQAAALRTWLSAWPEKILFGTDASPTTDTIGWEETGWVAAHETREALAVALTGMMADGEISPTRARELARMVLHDNAARLYGITAQ
jgi:predicted TIM-barrel fold metal-dependent hydrolase